MLSVHLQQTIAEILPSADPIDTPEFNPIEYINTMFPNEQSLIGIYIKHEISIYLQVHF
jgi:hypothetical protein